MRAMILAAGRGKRMGKLTELLPKPLLHVGGHYLIEYNINQLKRAGIKEIIINVAYRSEQIKQALGDGRQYGINILYSEEKEPLETGGGILNALSLLGNKPFIVISSDIVSDYPIKNLFLTEDHLAHLIMIKNPLYHPDGDFGFKENKLDLHAKPAFTFGSMGIYHPDLFADCKPGYFRLADVLKPAILKGKVSGECYTGLWYNIGTKEDLEEANARAREDSNLRPLASETNTLSN